MPDSPLGVRGSFFILIDTKEMIQPINSFINSAPFSSP
jgi:hypothetical protein